MADEILGISGHFDLSDIQKSINELIDGLDKIGLKTDVLSKRMNDAMNDIARSTDDAATKNKRALDVMSQGIAEAKNALANYPEQLRRAMNEADATAQATARLEESLAKLKEKFSDTTIGTEQYRRLKSEMAGVEQQIISNNHAHEAQLATIQQMEAGYNGLVSLYGVANTATTANAVAHSATAVTVGAEAAQHAVNTEKIGEETKAALENRTAKEQQIDISQRISQAVEMETSSYDGLLEKLQAGKVSSEEYTRVVEGLRERIAALRNESLNVGEKLDTEQAKALTWTDGGSTPLGDENSVRALREEYSVLSSQIGALEGVLSEVEGAWKSMHGAAQQAQAGVASETQRATEAQREYNTEAEKQPNGFRQQWENVNEMHDKIRELTKELREHEEEYDRLADKPGFNEQSKKAKELQEHISKLKKEIAETKEEMSEETGVGGFLARWKNQLTDVLTGHGKFQESLGGMKTALGGLVAPFSAATAGAMAFTKSLWAMAATPIGAVISAIILGLQAMYSWFTKDAEGQRAFTKITAYLGSLLSSITDIAVRIGKYLFHAFADPQGALNQLGRGLIGMVVNPLKAVGNTLAGVGQIAKGVIDLIRSGANVSEARRAVDSISKGWNSLKSAAGNVADTIKSVWNTGAGAVSGAYNLISKGMKETWETNLTDAGTRMFETARQSAQLAGEELNAHKALSEAKRDEAKLDIEIAKEREKIYTLTGKEKDAQIEKVKQMLREKYQPQIEAQQKLLEIQQKRNSLHTVSLEQLSKEREAQGAVYALQARAASSTRMLVRMQQANLRSMANANKKDARQQIQIDSAEGAYNEIERKNATARAKFFQDMEQKITDARIAAMKEGSEKVIEERKRSLEKELEQLDEQRNAAIEAERARQKAEFEAQEKIIKARGGTPKQWSDNMIDKGAIDSINGMFEKLRAFTVTRFQNDEIQQQIQSMREYLKEYGTFQEQKLAIAQEYAEKIAKAEASGNMGEVLKLKAEQNRVQGEAKAQELARGIDFTALVGGVSDVVRKIGEATYQKIQEYKQTDEYKNSSAENKQSIANLERQVVEKGGAGRANPFSTKAWDAVKTATKEYNDALDRLQAKYEAHTDATNRQIEAENRLNNLLKGFDATDVEEAIRNIDKMDVPDSFKEMLKNNLNEAVAGVGTAQKEAQQTGKEQKDAEGQVTAAGGRVSTTLDYLNEGLSNFSDGLSQITSGSLKGFADGLVKIISGGDKSSLAELGKGGGIIGMILTIIDMLGDNPSEAIAGIIDGILNCVDAIIEQLLSGELIGALVEHIVGGIAKIIGSLVDGVGELLGFGSLFGGKDNHEEMLKRQDKYNNMLDTASKAVGRFTEELQKSYGALAMENADKAEDIVRESMKTIMKGIDSVMWDNYGGGHSDYWHANNALNALSGDLQNAGVVDFFKRHGLDMAEGTTRDFWTGEERTKYTWNQLFNVNDPMKLAEAFKEMRDSGSDLWRIITTEMGANDGALKEWIEKLISAYEQIDDIEETALERITTTTKENVMNGFLDDLYSMANSTDDVFENIADNWQEMVNKMTINNLVANNFKSKLEKWYTELAKANEQRLSNGDNDWYRRELDRLKAEYEEYARSAQNQIEELRAVGIVKNIGTNPDQQTTYNSLEKWTYDQADEFINRATAMQIIGEHIYEGQAQMVEASLLMAQRIEGVSGGVSMMSESINTAVELHRQSIDRLDMIVVNTNPIPEIRDIVKKISNNL